MLSSTRGPCTFQWAFITALALSGEALPASENCQSTASNAELGNVNRLNIRAAGALAASDYASSYCSLAGYNARVGSCGDVEIGPLPEAEYTPEEAWLKSIEAACSLEVLPRELLQEDSVWTYLTGLCARPPNLTVQPILYEDFKRITGKDNLPRACGLLALMPHLRKQKPQPALSPPTITVSRPKAAPPPQAAVRPSDDHLTLDTTVVTGHQALPKVLYIVPWKKSEIGEVPSQPFNTLLDEALTPLDRDVFRREVEYYNKLSGAATGNDHGETLH